MNMRDLIPWGRNQQTPGPSREAGERSLTRDPGDPFLTLHREMNRLFDDVFRGFDLMPLGNTSMTMSWPNLEVVETDKEVRVCAELPGMGEKDVEVLLEDGMLTLKGEKQAESQHEGRRFSERFYGRFVRQVPVGDIEEDQVEASFKDGVLTVTMPKTARAQEKTRRITINSKAADTKH